MNKNQQDNKKISQLQEHTTDNQDTKLTTNQGLKINNNQDSLKTDERGSTLLEDFHSEREKLPILIMKDTERIVHARGSGAAWCFQA